jgi:molybdenum cofactor cytidylyltransferase
MPHKQQTAGIILAAGMSERFGQPKQLLKLKEKILLEWVIDTALASRLDSVFLVLGHAHREIIQALGTRSNQPNLQILINGRYREGQSTSLRSGLLKVRSKYSSVMFLLGDQPMLKPVTIDRMLMEFWQSDKNICVPVWKGNRGNPTIFSQAMYRKLMEIEGDTGARRVILKYQDQVLAVEVNDPLIFLDIDTHNDLERVSKLL